MDNPLDDKLERIYRAIGRLVSNFAQLEQMLNSNLFILHRKHGGDTVAPEMRIELRQKLTFLRRAVDMADVTQIGREFALGIADEIAELAETRHICIHRALYFTDLDDDDPLGASFDHFILGEHSRVRKNSHLFVGDIEKAADQAWSLTTKLVGLHGILDHSLAEKVKETLRELQGSSFPF